MLTYKTNHRSGTPSLPPALPPSSLTSSSSPSPISRNTNITTGLPSLRSRRNRRGRSRGSGLGLGRRAGWGMRRCVCGPLLKTWSTDLLVCEQMSSIYARLAGTTPTKAFFLVKPSKTKGEVEIAPVEEWTSFFEGVPNEDVRFSLSFVLFPAFVPLRPFVLSCSTHIHHLFLILYLFAPNIHSCNANIPPPLLFPFPFPLPLPPNTHSHNPQLPPPNSKLPSHRFSPPFPQPINNTYSAQSDS